MPEANAAKRRPSQCRLFPYTILLRKGSALDVVSVSVLRQRRKLRSSASNCKHNVDDSWKENAGNVSI